MKTQPYEQSFGIVSKYWPWRGEKIAGVSSANHVSLHCPSGFHPQIIHFRGNTLQPDPLYSRKLSRMAEFATKLHFVALRGD